VLRCSRRVPDWDFRSAPDPASHGVACFTSVPPRALLARSGRSKLHHPSQYPWAQWPSATSRSRATSESVPLDFNRARVRLAPSVSVPQGAQAVSIPRAVSEHHYARPTRRASLACAVAPAAKARAWVGIGTRAVPGARWRSLGRTLAGGPRRWADEWWPLACCGSLGETCQSCCGGVYIGRRVLQQGCISN
jgi:hypothetical protein